MEENIVRTGSLSGLALRYAFAAITGKLDEVIPARLQGEQRVALFCSHHADVATDPAAILAMFPAYNLQVDEFSAREPHARVVVTADNRKPSRPAKPPLLRVKATGPDVSTAVMRAVVMAHMGDDIVIPAALAQDEAEATGA